MKAFLVRCIKRIPFARYLATKLLQLAAATAGTVEAVATKGANHVLLTVLAENKALQARTAEVERAATERAAEFQRERQRIEAACAEHAAGLQTRIDQLTEALTESERKLQKRQETDYQVLMTHQSMLAGFRDAEPQFQALYERCKAHTMTSAERLYSLYKAIEYISAARIPGDIAECGVWRGGSCMLAALALLERGSVERRLLMFDTFAGHPRPDPEKDVDLWGNRAIDEWRQRNPEGAPTALEWGYAPLPEVRATLEATGYPPEKLVFVQGMVEHTVPRSVPQCLALLRLDTDWYESCRVALVHLYPRLAPGGVLVIDDYGHYRGQRQAVDEYFQSIGEHVLLHRIDYACRVAIKRAG